MKTKNIIAILGALVALAACSYYFFYPRNYVPVHRESILIDFTDVFTLHPQKGDMPHIFSWDEIQQARAVRIRSITDVDQGDTYEFALPPFSIPGQWHTYDLASSDIQRGDKIEAFEKSVWEQIEALYVDSIGYTHTSLLMPLVEELLLLQEHPNDERSFAIYSDLEENREKMSFLNPTTLKELEADNLSLWESIPGAKDLTNLSGIVIYFIHRPMSGEAAEHYRTTSQYLKRRLESYGAHVIIQGKATHAEITMP